MRMTILTTRFRYCFIICMACCVAIRAVCAEPSASISLEVSWHSPDISASAEALAQMHTQLLDAIQEGARQLNAPIADRVQVRVTTEEQSLQDGARSSVQFLPVPAASYFFIDANLQQRVPDGVRTREFSYTAYAASHYAVNDNDIAINMLVNKRLAGVVDYDSNGPIYTLAIPGVQRRRLRPAQPLYIDFGELKHKTLFERGVMALGSRANNFFVVGERPESDKPVLHWIVINKFFSPSHDTLIPLMEDERATKWWQDVLTDYQFYRHNLSSSVAFEWLERETQACVMNVQHSTAREEKAIFSLPSMYYQGLRLYAREDSTRVGALNLPADASLDLMSFLTEHSHLLLAYSGRMFKPQDALLEFLQASPKRFIDVDMVEKERALMLLLKERVDVLLDFPTAIKQTRLLLGEHTPINSFSLVDTKSPMAVNIACSNSEQGQQVVNKINQMLSDAEKRARYFGIYAGGLTPLEADDLLRTAITTP